MATTRTNTRSNGTATTVAPLSCDARLVPFTDERAHNTIKFAEITADDFLAIPVLGGNLYLSKAAVATTFKRLPQVIRITVEAIEF
jgi:hypothetical protein